MSKQLFPLISIFCLIHKFVNGLVCSEYYSCSAVAISSTTEANRFTSKRPVWLESCNCDQKCHSFGDCCLDAPSVKSNPLKEWSVLNIRINPSFTYYGLIKTKCPKEWTNRRVRQMCENIGFKESEDFLLSELGHLVSPKVDEFLLWPVTGRSSLITYRNIYCAFCNNETLLDSWTQKLKCMTTSDGEKCSTVDYPSPPLILDLEKTPRKPFQLDVGTTCNTGWYKTNIEIDAETTIEIIKNCTRFYAPVVVKNRTELTITPFKNEFCAKCNGFEEKDLLCPFQSENFWEHRFPLHFTDNLQFDTDFMSGGLIPNKNTSCPANHVFNPLENKCRLIVIEDSVADETHKSKDRVISNEISKKHKNRDESVVSDPENNYVTEKDESTALSKLSNQSSNDVLLRNHEFLFICLTILINFITNALF